MGQNCCAKSSEPDLELTREEKREARFALIVLGAALIVGFIAGCGAKSAWAL